MCAGRVPVSNANGITDWFERSRSQEKKTTSSPSAANRGIAGTEDPASIGGWPGLQAPDDDPDSWCDFDDETVDWVLDDGRTQRVCDNIDDRNSIGEHEFLGIRTGTGQYTLYDLEPGSHWNHAFYSNRGLGATDVLQYGDGFVPASRTGTLATLKER